jgi:LEA14-like dessication related protein
LPILQAIMKKSFFPLFLIVLLTACGKMKDPVFKGIENVKVNEVGMSESTITLDIRYHNPNNFKGLLKQAEGDAWMDSTYLGHFIVDSSVHIPANSEFLVPVKMAVDMKKMLKHSLAAFLNENVLLRITGQARAGKSGFYRNFSLNYQGMQNLRELFK